MKRTPQIIIWLIGLLAVGTFLFGVWQLVGAWTSAEGNNIREQQGSDALLRPGEAKTNSP